ncbi:glycolate oxidase [Microtetraspora sp. NBRC 13810]|uniref:FAD-binding oxidoreductase n=1 Tax=Microtetraspora sp. NBRC 13810 TaxID=3030990 RepID=UPI0024A07490|nr:FAD-binding oxidoreductase [Microtetraspora sp. NBRC 13810]GLW08568.1 glycolate oxidase [Microtetraspora sp. NBRC 13810]
MTATLEALEKTGVAVREATAGDTAAGAAPRWVALPESTGEAAALMRACAEHDLAVVPVGGGTKLRWGRPPERCDLLVDTRRMNRITEHLAGDMVVRTQAGVTLGELSRVLAEGGQELALDAAFKGATVGGTLATATAGPRRFRYGTARDLLIGITVVLADGTVARSGGKVVKNVAGYDLGKLFTGSYGTLGLITEATFRLHPLPPLSRWVRLTLPSSGRLQPLALALAASQAEPAAVELDRPGREGPVEVAVLVAGVAADERAEAMLVMARAVADVPGTAVSVTREAPGWWGRPPGEEVLLELRLAPTGLADALRAVAAWPGAAVRGSMASVVLQVAVPAGGGAAEFAARVTELRAATARHGGRVVVLAAPAGLAREVDPWGATGAMTLMRRVRERFDPDRRMSPGRLAGGI